MPNTYKRLEEHDDISDGSTFSDAMNGFVRPSRFPWWDAAPWLLHLLLMIAYTPYYQAGQLKISNALVIHPETLLGAPIVWEERKYLTNIHTGVFDPYSMSNPNVDQAWRSLIDTHVTTITEEEKNNLPGHRDTAPAYGGEPGYAVLIEVFHQLHCLNAIREGYYSGNNSEIDRGFADPGGHSDHCFSYLLQTLMCHADVGVMTTTWNPRAHVFMADFNVTKQCRNYDAIKTWAGTRKAKLNPPKRE